MSYQAMAWAIEQDVDSPSARCVLMSIANYANEEWCAWPKQELIAREGVQSVNSVQRRMPNLVGRGLLRRIKLKRFGRRTHDFYILQRSPFFCAPLENIRPLLPSGCDVIEDDEATAECGSDQNDSVPVVADEPMPNATAECGSLQDTTLPQSAVHATASVRQPIDEPVKNLRDSPPTPPPGGDANFSDQREGKIPFSKFSEAYPGQTISNYAVATNEWLKLDTKTQSEAIKGAWGYTHFVTTERNEGRNRAVKDAHVWLRNQLWQGYLNRDKSDPQDALHRYKADSLEARAVNAIHALARVSPLRVSSTNEVAFIGEMTPQLLAMGDAPVRSAWHWITARKEIGAWAEFVATHVRKSRPTFIEKRGHEVGIFAPWPWPPRKDGTLSTAGPSELMTAEDHATNL